MLVLLRLENFKIFSFLDPPGSDLELKLTHNDSDKGGHDAQVLEALRNFSFSHFTKGTAFVPLR